jgi:hypothetical protein
MSRQIAKLEIQGLNSHDAHDLIEALRFSVLPSRSVSGLVTCEGFKPLDVS